MKQEPGYETTIVMAFLRTLSEYREDGVLEYLNGQRVDGGHREQIDRWLKYDVVPLYRIDAFLHKYGLMTFELEHYALEHYGRDGFHDPYAEPLELTG